MVGMVGIMAKRNYSPFSEGPPETPSRTPWNPTLKTLALGYRALCLSCVQESKHTRRMQIGVRFILSVFTFTRTNYLSARLSFQLNKCKVEQTLKKDQVVAIPGSIFLV